ncbi:unnamed protein product [Caenorhabditis brenneri]
MTLKKSSNILPKRIAASNHQMVTRSKAKSTDSKLVAPEIDPDVLKLDLAEAMEKLPGWRPPARKKRVVVDKFPTLFVAQKDVEQSPKLNTHLSI